MGSEQDLVSCYDHPESNNSESVYFADTTAEIPKPPAHDEVWLVLPGIYIYIYYISFHIIYLQMQYLQLFHVPCLDAIALVE